jgi:hypothetical protein
MRKPIELRPDYNATLLHRITIVPLPPKCLEINAQKNVWQYIRDNWLL